MQPEGKTINSCLMSYILHSDWSLLSVNMESSLYCKQGSIILQLPVVYEIESTTSCQYMENTPVSTETRVKWKIYIHQNLPGDSVENAVHKLPSLPCNLLVSLSNISQLLESSST